jgi:Ca2+-binding RTX toxin-like protein
MLGMIDMRVIASILILLFASLFTTASLAQAALRECPTVDLLGPADGAVLDPGYRVDFTWDSEPRGTASREWISVKVDLDDASFTFENAKHEAAERGLYKGFARGTPGVYAWAVIFYDADGNPICQSEARTYFVTGTGFADAPANFQPGGVAVVKVSLGRYVIVLTGFSGNDGIYTGGKPFKEVKSDFYDGTGQVPDGYDGLEIWGNNNINFIKGSEKSDEIHGGDESCSALGGCSVGDVIDGGDGDDTIFGGNESCGALGICTAGDIIAGGEGNDTIFGGDEGCIALGACSAGDLIAGGNGDDTITGGQEDCLGGACNAADVIDGGPGTDTIVPSPVANTCAGLACNINDVVSNVP